MDIFLIFWTNQNFHRENEMESLTKTGALVNVEAAPVWMHNSIINTKDKKIHCFKEEHPNELSQ